MTQQWNPLLARAASRCQRRSGIRAARLRVARFCAATRPLNTFVGGPFDTSEDEPHERIGLATHQPRLSCLTKLQLFLAFGTPRGAELRTARQLKKKERRPRVRERL